MLKFKVKNRFFLVFPITLSILAFTLTFVSGTIHPSTFIEKKANDIADVVVSHTIHKQYLPLIVQPKKEEGSTMEDPGSEFHDLYGSFKENIASYASLLNGDHSHEAYFDSDCYRDFDNNICFLYVRSGFNFVLYDKQKNIYKHEKYPIETMFDRTIIGTTPMHLACISQSHADRILDYYEMEHTVDNYKSLLGNKININIDGEGIPWEIFNIYYEQNYYCEAIRNYLGDFIFVTASDHEKVENQSVYFLSSYTFRNKYYINYALSSYPQDKYNYSFGKQDLETGFIIDDELCVFENKSEKTIVASVLFVLSIILLIASLFLLLFIKRLSALFVALYLGISFVPYVIFKFIFVLTNNIIFFSSFSTMANWIMILSSIVIASLVFIWRRFRLYV